MNEKILLETTCGWEGQSSTAAGSIASAHFLSVLIFCLYQLPRRIQVKGMQAGKEPHGNATGLNVRASRHIWPNTLPLSIAIKRLRIERSLP